MSKCHLNKYVLQIQRKREICGGGGKRNIQLCWTGGNGSDNPEERGGGEGVHGMSYTPDMPSTIRWTKQYIFLLFVLASPDPCLVDALFWCARLRKNFFCTTMVTMYKKENKIQINYFICCYFGNITFLNLTVLCICTINQGGVIQHFFFDF